MVCIHNIQYIKWNTSLHYQGNLTRMISPLWLMLPCHIKWRTHYSTHTITLTIKTMYHVCSALKWAAHRFCWSTQWALTHSQAPASVSLSFSLSYSFAACIVVHLVQPWQAVTYCMFSVACLHIKPYSQRPSNSPTTQCCPLSFFSLLLQIFQPIFLVQTNLQQINYNIFVFIRMFEPS